MTDVEIRICKALDRISMGLDSKAKSFLQAMMFASKIFTSTAADISPKQSLYLAQLAWKYRRQLPKDIVTLAALKGGVSDRKDRRKTATAAT